MSQPDFSLPSTDLIMFEGYRTGPLVIPNFATYPALYNETLTIKSFNVDNNSIKGLFRTTLIFLSLMSQLKIFHFALRYPYGIPSIKA